MSVVSTQATLPSATALISESWQIAKKYYGFLVSLFVAWFCITAVVNVGFALLSADQNPNPVVMACAYVLVLAVQYVVTMGCVRIMLKVVRNQHPTLGELFGEVQLFWSFIGAYFAYSLLTVVGFFLLIVPGVNWAVKYVFAPFIVIDKHVGVKEALHHSAQLTEGIKLKLIGIYVVYCIIMML
jgi:hypothetical protein